MYALEQAPRMFLNALCLYSFFANAPATLKTIGITTDAPIPIENQAKTIAIWPPINNPADNPMPTNVPQKSRIGGRPNLVVRGDQTTSAKFFSDEHSTPVAR
mgnify:CR=1 FL=1